MNLTESDSQFDLSEFIYRAVSRSAGGSDRTPYASRSGFSNEGQKNTNFFLGGHPKDFPDLQLTSEGQRLIDLSSSIIVDAVDAKAEFFAPFDDDVKMNIHIRYRIKDNAEIGEKKDPAGVAASLEEVRNKSCDPIPPNDGTGPKCDRASQFWLSSWPETVLSPSFLDEGNLIVDSIDFVEPMWVGNSSHFHDGVLITQKNDGPADDDTFKNFGKNWGFP